MSEQAPRQPDPRLQVGFTVMIEKDRGQTKASVTVLTETEIVVELANSKKMSQFEDGGEVRVKYWDESAIYFCSGKVLRATETSLAISVYSEPIAMQRRGVSRLAFAVPLSIKVTEAAHTGLASQKLYQAQTGNISPGGVRFDSDLPLRAEDVVELQIDLPSGIIGATGVVVSANKVLRDGTEVNSLGVEFFTLPGDIRNMLMEFILENTPVLGSEG